jgi:hypothetical protein
VFLGILLVFFLLIGVILFGLTTMLPKMMDTYCDEVFKGIKLDPDVTYGTANAIICTIGCPCNASKI